MALRRMTALAGLGLLAALQTSAVEAKSGVVPVVESPRQVTSDGGPLRLWDIPALAVDPRDPSTVVMAVGNARDGGCGLRVSRDGGQSWATTAASLLPPDRQFCIQNPLGPVMAPAFGSDGTLHVSMSATSADTGRTNGPIDWVVANTTDLGATHQTVNIAKSETTTVNPADYGGQGTPQTGNSWYKFHSLTVDPKDPQRIYAGARFYVWGKDLQFLPGDIPLRAYFATSGDGGKTWDKPVDILAVAKGDQAYGASSPSLVVAPNGDIYGFSKEYAKSLTAVETKSDARVLMFKSTDHGKTWTTSVVPGAGGANFLPPLAAIDNHNGNIYVAYGTGPASTSADKPAPAPQKVYVTRSTDQGKTWSTPAKVDDPQAPQDHGDEFYPNISVAPNGRVDVAWYDFRNDPNGPRQVGSSYRGERYWDVYYAYSTDDGASWSPNMRVTSPSIDGKQGATFDNIDTRGPIGLAATNQAAYVAWPDSRATDAQGDAEDAYFTRLRYVPESPLGATADQSGRVWGLFGAGVALAVGGGVLLIFGRRRSTQAA